MIERCIEVREYCTTDCEGVSELISIHMKGDCHWPPSHARTDGALEAWLEARSDVGRWIANESDHGQIVGHVGVSTTPTGNKTTKWASALGCDPARLAEIGRLIVHPDFRRTGVSASLTRRCIRDTVEQGYIPVASALARSKASQAMMLNFGWRVIGKVLGQRSNQEILLLVAPRKLVDAANTIIWD